MGLAIQAVMGPFNIWENVLVRTVLLRGTKVFSDPKLQQELRIFDEKLSLQELDSSTDEKFSRHLIIDGPYYFANNSIMGIFIERFIQTLPSLVPPNIYDLFF